MNPLIEEDTAANVLEQSHYREVTASIAFSKPSDVSADHERKGLLRAAPHSVYANADDALEFHPCRVRDWASSTVDCLDLDKMGFDSIDLSPLLQLQTVLEGIRRASHISTSDASALRRLLSKRSFKLSNGKRLRLLFIAPEGLIMRQAGPNGLTISPAEEMTEMNGHDGAVAIHGDQDVYGTPLRQMMKGMAPYLFRHQTPDGKNRLSPVCLVNLWIPLQQITRPLTLMDRRTLDNRRHQLRYALPTDNFLNRDEECRVNDIWAFLHDEHQQWYCHSDMDAKRAYVFDTLGEPHGSLILPGENVAEKYYCQLRLACSAINKGDRQALLAATQIEDMGLPVDTTEPIRKAIDAMKQLLARAAQTPDDFPLLLKEWLPLAKQSMDKVVRKSIEMRAVAIITPDVWPFNRD